MNTTIVISEVLSTSWKNVKSQIWILAGLFIGLCLIAFTVSLLMMPCRIAGSLSFGHYESMLCLPFVEPAGIR